MSIVCVGSVACMLRPSELWTLSHSVSSQTRAKLPQSLIRCLIQKIKEERTKEQEEKRKEEGKEEISEP